MVTLDLQRGVHEPCVWGSATLQDLQRRVDLRAQHALVLAALGVHALMAALVVLGTMNWQPFRQDQPTAIAIEAVIVDTSEIKRQRDEARRAAELEERRRQRAAELERQRQRELEQERQREEEAARRQRELEAQRKEL